MLAMHICQVWDIFRIYNSHENFLYQMSSITLACEEENQPSSAHQTNYDGNNMNKAFNFRFIDAAAKVSVELTNATDETLKSIEILTIFLKEPDGGPSQAHIRFDGVKAMQPGEKTILSHRTWINGKPSDSDHDQMERLKPIAGQASPYALEISWEDPEGKMRFQRIPISN